MAGKLIPFAYNVPICDPENGYPTPAFLRALQALAVGSSLTVGPGGTISLSSTPDKTVLGNNTGAPATPVGLTLSQVLDFVGSAAQGDILYRNATGWVRLGAGTSGQVLTTGGTGANPAWATPSGGGGSGLSPIIAGTLSPPTTSTFTLVSGAGSPSQANVSRGVRLTVPGAGAVDRNAGLEVTPAGSTWTMTALLVPNVWWRNYMTFGLYAKESGSGKIHAFTQGYDSSLVARVLQWNTITSFNTSANFPTFVDQGPLWFKLQLDATNFTLSLSQDGENWLQVYQVAKGSFLSGTINRAGIWLGVNQQSTGGYPQNVDEYLTVMSFTIV